MTGKENGGIEGGKEANGQLELQEDELMALEAILPPSEFRRAMTNTTTTPPISGPSALPRQQRIWLSIPAVLPTDAWITVQTRFTSPKVDKSGAEARPKMIQSSLKGIGYLPPLKILIDLPPRYPNDAPPIIRHLTAEYLSDSQGATATSSSNKEIVLAESLAASFRSKVLSWLKISLYQQWDEMRGEILYTWYEYLKEGLWQDIIDGRVSSDCPLLSSEDPFRRSIALVELSQDTSMEGGDSAFHSPLAASLRAHDLVSKRKEFEGERYGCGICLEDKRGGKCYRIADCGHVFCQECLTSYLSSMIREGYIRQASNCPDPECVKARVIAENKTDAAGGTDIQASSHYVGVISQEEMLHFVGEELIKRLQRLQEKASASADPTAGYCPRPGCENLVRGDARDIGTMYEQMRMCACGFTYCLYCSKAWHGKSPCNLVSSAALIERYKQAAENGTIRREMELKYGKTNLERMVRTYEEEMENKRYIDSHTQRCPCCAVAIEKSMGCNHMACRACKTHFCYRCGTRLNAQEPYRHFNTPGTNCFGKLFDAVGIVDGPAGAAADWAFIGADEEEMAMWEAEQL